VDEYVFQMARAIVGAEMQAITYNEFLPALVGPDHLESYDGYDAGVNAGIANIFSGSLFRVGHTMLPEALWLLDEDGQPVPDQADVMGAMITDGEVTLSDAFFNPALITQMGIEPYFQGLALQPLEEIDPLMVDAVRNLLFAPPAATDLGATNLQRGRDHGLPDYNQTRIDFGLAPVTSFAEISSHADVVSGLEAAYDAARDGVNGYDAINNIDVFAGAISEDHVPGGSVGQLIQTVLVDQFTRLRDGDRFYYEKVFEGEALDEIQNTRLADIIRRNTGLQNIQDEVFRDDRVLTFRGEEGHAGMQVTLRVRDDQLQVVQGASHQMLATADLGETDIVVIYGTSHHDTIRIDPSFAAAFTGSVELHGGGGFDRLLVHHHDTRDNVEVTPSGITMGDLAMFHGNFEQVAVAPAWGPTIGSPARGVDFSLVQSASLSDTNLNQRPGPSSSAGLLENSASADGDT
ncbi:MAG: hypothetical protein GTO03_04095, partial [Planctomycetales bacterium]|nr:hypothetical protein [Planctomycetales bacterium]